MHGNWNEQKQDKYKCSVLFYFIICNYIQIQQTPNQFFKILRKCATALFFYIEQLVTASWNVWHGILIKKGWLSKQSQNNRLISVQNWSTVIDLNTHT